MALTTVAKTTSTSASATEGSSARGAHKKQRSDQKKPVGGDAGSIIEQGAGSVASITSASCEAQSTVGQGHADASATESSGAISSVSRSASAGEGASRA